MPRCTGTLFEDDSIIRWGNPLPESKIRQFYLGEMTQEE